MSSGGMSGGLSANPASPPPSASRSGSDDANPLAAAVRALIAGGPVPDVLGPAAASPAAKPAPAPIRIPSASTPLVQSPAPAAAVLSATAAPATEAARPVAPVPSAAPVAALMPEPVAPMKARRRPTAIYIVFQSLNRWWVDFEGKAYGPFNDPEDARKSGIEIARIFGDETRMREVVVMRDGRGHDVVWSSANQSAA